MRKKLVIGNWKMNLDKLECIALVNEVIDPVLRDDIEIVFAPPFVYLDLVSSMCLDKENFYVAAQNCSCNDNGAFTGEVSAKMIESLNAKYIILGHSERRQNFNESGQILNLKSLVSTFILLKSKFHPLFSNLI
jgi:triosephosphate isomerase